MHIIRPASLRCFSNLAMEVASGFWGLGFGVLGVSGFRGDFGVLGFWGLGLRGLKVVLFGLGLGISGSFRAALSSSSGFRVEGFRASGISSFGFGQWRSGMLVKKIEMKMTNTEDEADEGRDDDKSNDSLYLS